MPLGCPLACSGGQNCPPDAPRGPGTAPRMPLRGPSRNVALGSKGDGLVQRTCTARLYNVGVQVIVRATAAALLSQSVINMRSCWAFSRIIVNRPVRTRMQGGVCAGVRRPRLPD
jgi:hypothetical protein